VIRLAGVLVAALALGAVAAPPVHEFEGTVVRVVDGDSVHVAPADGGALVTVRLHGIDAPEICQPHGLQAKQALEEMVFEQRVRARPIGIDDHGRLLARLAKGGADVGDRLVRDGHAWSYRYRDDKGPYVMQERMARALQRGLHADRAAEPPRLFRRRHGPCPAP
jgi:endonuclease YncB( thermonuclease family)